LIAVGSPVPFEHTVIEPTWMVTEPSSDEWLQTSVVHVSYENTDLPSLFSNNRPVMISQGYTVQASLVIS